MRVPGTVMIRRQGRIVAAAQSQSYTGRVGAGMPPASVERSTHVSWDATIDGARTPLNGRMKMNMVISTLSCLRRHGVHGRWS
jgi:hypothetical protein